MILFLPCLLNGFLIPYLRSQVILTTDLPGVFEISYTDDTVLPSEKGGGGAVGARVLPVLQGSFPFLGDCWNHHLSL